MGQILTAVSNIITQCSAWFLQVLTAVDGLAVWSTAVLVCLTYRFLLKPLFGSSKSDTGITSYNAFSRRKDE